MALIDVIGWVGKRRWARPVGVPMMLAARRIPLATMVRLAGRRICIPSAGYSAIALSGTSVRENLLDGSLMYQTLAGAIERFALLTPVGVMMEGNPESVRLAVGALLERFGSLPNFVLGSGCDLPGETPLENIDALMAARE